MSLPSLICTICPPKVSEPELGQIPQHFIHEIKTKGYDVIGVNLFLPKLMKFLPKKTA